MNHTVRRSGRSAPLDPNKLFELRMRAGLEQRELAAKADMSYQQISAIERGVRGTSVSALHRLAHALDCDVADLMRTREP